MNAIKQFWQDLKSKPDIWFFYAFLLVFPLSVRKVITLHPIQGRFNEYSGIYLYLSDIFLILALSSWIFILCHKYRILSIYTSTPFNRLKLWIKSFPQVTPKHFLAYLGLIFVLWSFLSIGWSESKSLSLFRSIKLLEFYLLAIFVAYRIVPRLPETKMFHVEHFWAGGTILRDTLKLVLFGGVINSILAIWQFAIQHSIGLTFLKESVITPNMPGVAKIILRSCPLGECSTWNIPSGVEHYIRAYGLLPHPNILGGLLLFSIILTIYYHKLFQAESIVPRGTFGGYLGWKMTVLIIIQLIALTLTFSKSAIIGLGIALIYIHVPRGTFGDHLEWNIQKIARRLVKTALFTFFAISVLISVFPGLSPIQNQSLEERQMIMDVSRNACETSKCSTWNILTGSGISQSVWSMRSLDLEDWQYQPVHNVFLLIWSELGIVGLVLFVLILWKMFHVEHSKGGITLRIFNGILLGFTFIMLFDHYPWDIQQGQIMLWMIIGLAYGFKLNNSDSIPLHS